jgi:surface polysaccharide O-acyltransferase-like enzyme
MKRKNTVDVLKAFMLLGIICIHTAPFKDVNLYAIDGSYIYSFLLILSRISVPLFFLSSGYFFHYKVTVENDKKKYVKKYLKKIISVLVSWICIYILYDLIINTQGKVLSLIEIKEYFSDFHILNVYYATGVIKYHLWFLVSLIIVVLIIYQVIIKSFINKFLIITLILNIVGVLLYIINPDFWIVGRDALFMGLFYTTLGVYIGKNEKRFVKLTENRTRVLIILSITFSLTSIIEHFGYAMFFHTSGDYYLSTIPLSFLVFILSISCTTSRSEGFLNKVGRNSLGIYVIHPLIISLIYLVIEKESVSAAVIWNLVIVPGVFVISHYSYKLIQLIKNSLLKNTNFKMHIRKSLSLFLK